MGKGGALMTFLFFKAASCTLEIADFELGRWFHLLPNLVLRKIQMKISLTLLLNLFELDSSKAPREKKLHLRVDLSVGYHVSLLL
jgi:hypothetical protein